MDQLVISPELSQFKIENNFKILILGTNQELKETKKKLEDLEEELQKFKRDSSIESGNLIQYYEQRVSRPTFFYKLFL